LKTALKIIGIVIALLIVVAIALPFVIDVNAFRPQIESNLSEALGRPVKVGDLRLSILSGSVGADQLSIADDPKFSQAPFIQAKSLSVGVELLPLILSKQLNVTDLTIENPDVTLLRNREGVWNFSSLGGENAAAKKQPAAKGSSNPTNLTVAKMELTDGKVSVGTIPEKRKPVVYDQVNLTMKDFSFTGKFPVTLSMRLPGGGSVKLDGTAGPINPNDTALTPLDAKLNIQKLDLAQSALVDPTLGITGSADYGGTLSSDGHVAKTNGTLTATSLKLVPKGSPATIPVKVTYTLEHDLQKETGRVSQCDVVMGKAVAKLTGTYDMKGETTVIHTKLVGQAMPVDDLEAMLPAVGVVLPTGSKLKGGTLSLDLASDGPVDKLVSSGPVKLEGTQLANFNLGSKLSAISALSGKQTGNDTTIQNLSANARYAPEGTKLDNIDLVVPAIGAVTGAGTVNPGGGLDFKMLANLSGGVAGGLTQIAGSGGIPFFIHGTTSNPSFMPDVKGMVGGELKGLLGGQGTGNNNPLGGLTGLFGKKKPSTPPNQ
jgi:AsmA protein